MGNQTDAPARCMIEASAQMSGLFRRLPSCATVHVNAETQTARETYDEYLPGVSLDVLRSAVPLQCDDPGPRQQGRGHVKERDTNESRRLQGRFPDSWSLAWPRDRLGTVSSFRPHLEREGARGTRRYTVLVACTSPSAGAGVLGLGHAWPGTAQRTAAASLRQVPRKRMAADPATWIYCSWRDLNHSPPALHHSSLLRHCRSSSLLLLLSFPSSSTHPRGPDSPRVCFRLVMPSPEPC